MAVDALDVTSVALTSNPIHSCADVDVIGTRCRIHPGGGTQCDIPSARRVGMERGKTDRRVAGTGRVASKRQTTVGRIKGAVGVAIERVKTDGGIISGSVIKERSGTDACVVAPGSIARER